VLRSSKRSLSLSFPHQDLVCPSPLHHMWCLPYPYYSSWFYHSSNVWSQKLHGTEHWTQLIVTQFSWNGRLITILTKALTCTCWMQSTPSYPVLCDFALVSVSVYHKWSLLLQMFFNQNVICMFPASCMDC
jgi:hypothetical protein